ncbi:titin-like [Eublepharis macularius]|uniref:Titin-like n=1 Tax=Eublepharis macularius TaxID=481883 RepID=A0AA97KDD6_EUBMA|nr:titin-like [Eublepharis macularius]
MRNLLPGKMFLLLLFLSYLHTALGENSSISMRQVRSVNGVNQPASRNSSMNASSILSRAALRLSVIQTPAALKVVEGSTLHMECSFQGNVTFWSIQWFKDGNKIALTNKDLMTIMTNATLRSSNLSLSKTVVADSGFYTCKVSVHKVGDFCSNGTQLTVDEIKDLMVNQTPEHISKPEGANLTLECRFRIVNDPNATDVRWYRNGTELTSSRDSLRIEVNRERGFASLTLKKAAVSDSGNYTCQVESRSRNLTQSGNTSRVVITTTDLADKNEEQDKQLGSRLAAVGGWAGGGAAILLLLVVVAGIIMWKRRSKVNESEPDTSPAKKPGLHPLASQRSEVTYADLHFHKREVQPDAEVVYAEVRAPQKQQACKDANQMRPKGKQRR